MIYEAFFIFNQLPHQLERDIEFKHVTTEFKPAIKHTRLYGCTGNFEVIGYGNDGVNEGLKVRLVSIVAPDEQRENELRELVKNVPVLHITLSVSKDGAPKDTSKLAFDQPIPQDFGIISGLFGGFIGKPVFKA